LYCPSNGLKYNYYGGIHKANNTAKIFRIFPFTANITITLLTFDLETLEQIDSKLISLAGNGIKLTPDYYFIADKALGQLKVFSIPDNEFVSTISPVAGVDGVMPFGLDTS